MKSRRILPSAADPSATPPFCTQTTGLAAFMYACGVPYKTARLASDLESVVFEFDDPDARCPQLVRQFNAGEASAIAPRTLFQALRFLKSEMKRVRGMANAKSAR